MPAHESAAAAGAIAPLAAIPNSVNNPNAASVRLSVEVVRIKRIPQREFEQPATSVVTLTPTLVTYPSAAAQLKAAGGHGAGVGGSGLRAAMVLASSSSNPTSPSRAGAGGSPDRLGGSGGSPDAEGSGSGGEEPSLALSVAPAAFATQQVFQENDPYYNDRVEFAASMPIEDDTAGEIQGFPAGVTLPPMGPDGKPLKGEARAKEGGNSPNAAADGLPSIPRPPTAGVMGRSSRKSVVTLSPAAIPVPAPPSHGRRQSRAGLLLDGAEVAGSGGSVLPAVPTASSSSNSGAVAAAPQQTPSEAKIPHFRVPVEVHDHARPSAPLLVLRGLLEIPAVPTRSDMELCVALVPAGPAAAAAAAASTTANDNGDGGEAPSAPTAAPSAAPLRDEIDVICPLLIIRYKVAVERPPKPPVDYHADVLLEEEPRYTPEHQLVPDVTLFSWYHLLGDRAWLTGFSQALIAQWSALPRIVYEDERAKSPPKKRGVGAPSFGGARPSSGRRGSSAGGVGAGASYTSIADLMLKHWAVKRSHEAVTRIRIVADKYRRGEHMGFTAPEEYRLKLQWRERQVLRTTMAVDLLADVSGSPVRLLLDRLWLNMVYGVPADDPSPPHLTYEMRNKLAKVAFTSKHAAILRACMLQLLVHGLSYADALKVATEDFEAKNVTYVSRRGSLVGGAFAKSEAIMMAFGQPVEPTVAPPMNEVSEVEQLQRLIEDNKKNIKAHQRRTRSRERQQQLEDGAAAATSPSAASPIPSVASPLNATLNATLAGADSTMGTLKDGTAAALSLLAGGGPNGCPLREGDFPTPTAYTSQKVFTTVVIDFVGRLLETLTDHEFIMILNAFIPAVTAASEKCLMVSSGIPSTLKASPKGKRAASAAKRRGNSAARGKGRRGSSVLGGGGGAASGGASAGGGGGLHPSGPVQIEYLDSLGRKLPKKGAPTVTGASESPIAAEAETEPEAEDGEAVGDAGAKASSVGDVTFADGGEAADADADVGESAASSAGGESPAAAVSAAA